jgi:hypothetical protein
VTGSKLRFASVAAAYFIAIAVASPALAQETRSTLVQQKMCADQADKFFRNLVAPASPKMPIDPLVASYVNHYDVKADICYVAVVRTEPSGKDMVYSITVFDAFEGTGYAGYIQTSDRIAAGLPVKRPVWCSVEPRGQDKVTCKSEHEFDTLIEKYFGLLVR